MKISIKKSLLFSWLLTVALSVHANSSVIPLTRPLESSAWNHSEWISVADAPVVEGVINASNQRAADGASWFMTTLKNPKKVVSGVWMTSGLGVYDLYVNGQCVGEEILKPGFTHYAKTKRSFTYDITKLFHLKANASNTLSVQVTPGWWGDKIITPNGNEGRENATPCLHWLFFVCPKS